MDGVSFLFTELSQVLLCLCPILNVCLFMQAQIDGKVVRSKFTLPERKKPASPPKAAATTSRRDGPKADDVAADANKDGPKRPRDGKPPYSTLLNP